MIVDNALAALAVRDLDAAAEWYERLLGPGARMMNPVLEWQFPQGGGLQVYAGPERAGLSACTLIVADVDAVIEHLRGSGLAPDAEAVHHDQVDTVMIRDPDGNSIAFAHPRDPSPAR